MRAKKAFAEGGGRFLHEAIRQHFPKHGGVMKLVACGQGWRQDPVEFWGSVPGVTSVHICADVAELCDLIKTPEKVDILVMRFQQQGGSEADALSATRRFARGIPVVAWMSAASAEDAFRLCYLGADELITDASSTEDRANALAAARARRIAGKTFDEGLAAGDEPWRQHLVGSSSSMAVVTELIRLISPRRCSVLITGETGTGKEIVARAIHFASMRAQQPMVCVNCNAIPGELLEAELFGHVKGAYTGAFTARVGRFEQANHGTLFLDEIGDLPFPLQAKLLRVLQEREFQRLGSSETVRVDVRVIAATNANLQHMVEKGKFRQDLYYRLNVAPIHLPPLRERLEDIPELAFHFVRKICANEQIPLKRIPPELIEWLGSFPWPGNIRQLENTVESAIALSGNRSTLRMADFAALLCSSPEQPRLFAMPSQGIDYNRVVDQFERTLLSEALRLAGGSKKEAAILLQLKRTTFAAKLDALRIAVEEPAMEEEYGVSAIRAS